MNPFDWADRLDRAQKVLTFAIGITGLFVGYLDLRQRLRFVRTTEAPNAPENA